MSVRYDTAAALLADNQDRSPDDVATIRFPYEVGLFAQSTFKVVIAFGRSLGLDIRVDAIGGILSKSGYLCVEGPWGDVWRFLKAWQCVEW